MGDRTSIRYRYGIWVIDMVIHHIDMVILDTDIGYGLMIWELTVSIWEMTISIWDMLSLSTRCDPLYHKKLRGQLAPKPRFAKMVDLRGY